MRARRRKGALPTGPAAVTKATKHNTTHNSQHNTDTHTDTHRYRFRAGSVLSVSQRRFCGSACELAGHRLSTCASQHACCNACWRHIRLSKCLIGEFVFVVMQVSVEPLFRIGGGYTASQHVCWRLPPFTITAIARITNIQQRFVFD